MAYIINLKTESCILERTENTDRFFNDIRKFKPLSEDEETELFDIIKHGTPIEVEKAKAKLLRHNLAFVAAVAKRYSTKDTFLDNVNECSEAFLECIDKFDPSRGSKFTTMAVYYLRLRMNAYRTQVEPMVKQTNRTKTFNCISKAINDFTQLNERAPSTDELLEIINEKYGKNINDKADIIDLKYTRVDRAQGDDDNYSEDFTTAGEVIEFNNASASENTYNSVCEKDYRSVLVTSLLSKLTPREQILVKMKYGINDGEYGGFSREYSMAEIADKLRITTERVRQMEKNILSKMKKHYKEITKKQLL